MKRACMRGNLFRSGSRIVRIVRLPSSDREKVPLQVILLPFGNVRVHRISSTVHYILAPSTLIVLRVEGVANVLVVNYLFYNSPVRLLCSVVQGVLALVSVSLFSLELLLRRMWPFDW